MAIGRMNWYKAGMQDLLTGVIDLDTDSYRAVLLTNSYTPDLATHSTWADASANEASGTGYSANGIVATLSIVWWSAISRFGIDCNNLVWTPNTTITAKYLAIVRDDDSNGSLASTDKLISLVDLNTSGGSVSSVNEDFSVIISGYGIWTIAPY